MSSRRVAWLTVEPPRVDGGGGGRRQHFLIDALRREFEVDVLVADPNTELVPTMVQRLWTKASPRGAPPRTSESVYAQRVLRHLVENEITTVVIAHVETAACLGALLERAGIHSILDVHNVYSRYYASQGRSFLARRWRHLEHQTCSWSQAVTCLSEEELKFLPDTPIVKAVVPNGVDMSEWPTPEAANPQGLAMFGSWNHRPNQVGLDWFLREAWPIILAANSDARLSLYGPGRPDLGGWSGVDFLGRSEALADSLSHHRGVIVPIVVGVGTRVKFIEALAAGGPVVSTTLGAEGYPVPNNMYLRADAPADFAKACIRVLEGGSAMAEMGMQARSFVADRFTWELIAHNLGRLIEGSLVDRPSS